MKTGRSHMFGDLMEAQKKRFSALLFYVFFITAFMPAHRAYAIDASIVVDANSDTVISQENADRLLHPASMSKLMTLYITFEALESGRITLQRSFPVSAHAESMSPTKLNLVAGQSIRVEDLILSLVTLSANDSAVVLAEGLGGSEDRFGQLMTRKAHQIGMVNTNFRNSNGLPDPAQISTARDMAILCRALIRKFPQYYHYFSVREFTYNGIEHANHNHLMSRYEGMDGLKTGLTNASGFNLAASAIRGGRRLIGVVFGGTSAVQRDDYMADLLDDGFRRSGGVAMTTAVPPPIPGHKPSQLMSAQASGGQNPTVASLPPAPVPVAPAPKLIGEVGDQTTTATSDSPAPLSHVEITTTAPPTIADNRRPAQAAEPGGVRINAPRPTTIGALATLSGQGDEEGPDDQRAANTSERQGDQRMAMLITPKSARTAAKAAAQTQTSARWSIQVGAYATRQATEQAIKAAIKRAPELLRHANAVVAALPQKHGTIYRGRLSGLEAAEARQACRLLSHCMTVPPGAS
ncbi:MAG: D-alanyl-D-alanine carboxypeptidase [Rhodospirillales bacterium]|nr:D-alanyl-D-alanine carboxypeptidase [Rhodospirillales bacterium]